MSIRPVDFQMVIPKSSELSRINNDEQNKNYVIQQQQGNIIQDKAENTLKQVYSQDKAQEARIRERQQKHPRKESRNKKNNEENKKDEDNTCNLGTGFIDIRI